MSRSSSEQIFLQSHLLTYFLTFQCFLLVVLFFYSLVALFTNKQMCNGVRDKKANTVNRNLFSSTDLHRAFFFVFVLNEKTSRYGENRYNFFFLWMLPMMVQMKLLWILNEAEEKVKGMWTIYLWEKFTTEKVCSF